MAHDERIAQQVREMIAHRTNNAEEKPMFGGLGIMVEDKLCLGVKKDCLMARIDPNHFEAALEKDGVRPMIHGGKPVPSYVFVSYDVMSTTADLAYWVNLALDYNPRAPLSQAKQKAAARSAK